MYVECIVEEKEREGGEYLDSFADKRRKEGKLGEETRVKTQTSASIWKRCAVRFRDLSMIFAADHVQQR